MSSIFQKIAASIEARLPFAIWRNPGEVTLKAVFQNNDTLYKVENFEENGFVFAEFNGKQTYLILFENAEILVEEFFPTLIKSTKLDYQIDAHSQNRFEQLVELAQQAINAGTFDKVVLSREEKLNIKIDQSATFKQLLCLYPTAFCSYWFHPKVGSWMGATPEQLLKVDNNKIQTVALAGTQKQSAIEDVVWQQKEIDEQEYVTHFIVDELRKLSQNVNQSQSYTYQAGSLFHIKTDIEATISSKKEISAILKALHPTPAVCGLPKQAARDFILKNENYDRSFYSGFIGELNNDENKINLFVNLRCMQLYEDSVTLYIGCGITAASDPSAEYFETVNKSMTMKNILIKEEV